MYQSLIENESFKLKVFENFEEIFKSLSFSARKFSDYNLNGMWNFEKLPSTDEIDWLINIKSFYKIKSMSMSGNFELLLLNLYSFASIKVTIFIITNRP